VIGAPDGFALGAPHRAIRGEPRHATSGEPRDDDAGALPYDVVLVFCPDQATLRRQLDAALARTATNGGLWIAWPKRASGVPTDLTENVVREIALPRGIVDVKVCAVDDVWSGLKLVRRLSQRG